MIQFQNFPIYVVYSLHRQQAVAPLWNQYYQERQNAQRNIARQFFKFDFDEILRHWETYKQKDALIDAAIEWQLTEDLDPKYRVEIKEYENTIEKLLNKISQTSLGKFLLSLINPNEKVWIIPANWDKPTATTDPATEAQGGGIRINFNPKAFQRIYVSEKISADEAEETLLHELVHAMRFSRKSYLPKLMADENFGNSEEFLATQFENIYHSIRRKSPIYSTYLGAYKTKSEMYQYFIEKGEHIMALKFFLKTEFLAKHAATLKQADYNPFRDFKELEQKSLKYFGIDKFNDF